MTRLGARLLWLTLTVSTIGCDQVTKQIAADNLADGVRRSFWHDTVRLQYTENTGAFLGLGSRLPAAIRTPVLVSATVILLLGVILALRAQRMVLAYRVGLYLILAAGLSNLWDRLERGRVIDFLNVGIGPLRTGIFNVADMALMLGVALVLLTRRSDGGDAPVSVPAP
ncbi:MAG: signal peptidase II [Gemmatimonadota bacterium]